MKSKFILLTLFIVSFYAKAQVSTNYDNADSITDKGKFKQDYTIPVYNVNPPDSNVITQNEIKFGNAQSGKPFRFAEPIAVNIDVVKLAYWKQDKNSQYGILSIRSHKAKSMSINFNNFYLPKGSELFIYNKKGEMITGAVTEQENNSGKAWGSSVYKGDLLTIEIKIPLNSKTDLHLNISNV